MNKQINGKGKFLALAVFVLALTISAHAAEPDLQPGAVAPAFTLKNQDGKVETLKSLAGPNGLLVLFSRSADWCGLC
jgi:hypothetical protein